MSSTLSRLWRTGLLASLVLFALGPIVGNPAPVSARQSAFSAADRSTLSDTTSGQIYIVYGNVRHLVATPQVLSVLGLTTSSATKTSSAELTQLPEGAPLTLRQNNGQLVSLSPVASGSALLSLSTAAVPAGEAFAVKGEGFAPNEAVQLVFNYGQSSQTAHADGSGSFTATQTMPANVAPSIMRFFAFGEQSKVLQVEPITVLTKEGPAQITADPAKMYPGQQVNISGSGFQPYEAVSVYFSAGGNTVDALANVIGSFTVAAFTAPSTISAGSHSIMATGKSSHRSFKLWVTIVARPIVNDIPSDGTLIRDQSNGRVYLVWGGVRRWILNQATLQALGHSNSGPADHSASYVNAIPQGAGLGLNLVDNLIYPLSPINTGSPSLRLSEPSDVPGKSFTVTGANFGHNEAVLVTFGGATQTVHSDGNGSFTASVGVPGSAAPGSIMSVVALGVTSRAFTIEPFSVTPSAPNASLVAQTPSVEQKANATVSGSGFAPGEQVHVFLGQTYTAVSATADANGNFVTTSLNVPVTLSPGSHTLIAFGTTSKHFAQGSINILQPAPAKAVLTLDRANANPGSLVQVRGSGFGAGEPVKIIFGTTLVLTTKASSSGQFGPVGITIPTTTAPGSYPISGIGQSTNRAGVAAIAVAPFNPAVAVSPAATTPSDTITVRGQGYAAGEVVTLALNGAALITSPGVIKTTASGTFYATFKVPATALSGANTVAATGATSRATATAVLSVTLPLQSTWYFAGGNTNPNYDTQIALVNPNSVPATVTFTFMFTSGSPMPYTATVGAYSRATVDLGSVVGPNRDVFTKLTSDRKIGASETVFRNGQDFSSTIGASAPLQTWYLAEGYTGISFHEYIRILNPGGTAAHVDVRLLPFNGRPASSVVQLVAAQTGAIVDVNSIVSGQSLSAIVSSDQPIVVERLITFGPNGYGATEQVGSTTASSTWLFAEGSTTNNFETYLTILNPSTSQPAAVTATFFDQAGNVLGNNTVIIDPLRRGNIKVNTFVHSSGIATILTANIPVFTERPLYFGSPNSSNAGGSVVFGRNGGGVTWLFPEGNTGAGFTEFLLVQNPSAQAAPVTVRFFETNGQMVDYKVTLPAKSRATVDVLRNVPQLPPGLHSAMVSSTSGVPIIVEQSIYSDNFTKGDGAAGISQ